MRFTRIRHSILAMLIVVLALTGHSMAIARGTPHAAGVIELCHGGSPVMVQVDAHGQPTGPAHICPEFSLMLSEIVTPAMAFSAVVGQVSRIARDRSAPLVQHVTSPRQTARAPPYDI